MRRGGREAEGTCLENRHTERYRRFESCPLRQPMPMPSSGNQPTSFLRAFDQTGTGIDALSNSLLHGSMTLFIP